MVFRQELYLRASGGVFGGNISRYSIGEDITVLTEANEVFRGRLMSIKSESFSVKQENKENIILYDNVRNIVSSDWLCDEDIRDI